MKERRYIRILTLLKLGNLLPRKPVGSIGSRNPGHQKPCYGLRILVRVTIWIGLILNGIHNKIRVPFVAEKYHSRFFFKFRGSFPQPVSSDRNEFAIV